MYIPTELCLANRMLMVTWNISWNWCIAVLFLTLMNALHRSWVFSVFQMPAPLRGPEMGGPWVDPIALNWPLKLWLWKSSNSLVRGVFFYLHFFTRYRLYICTVCDIVVCPPLNVCTVLHSRSILNIHEFHNGILSIGHTCIGRQSLFSPHAKISIKQMIIFSISSSI